MKAATWIATAAIIVVAALGFLYIGTTHRDRCIKAGNVDCTILPWSGSPSSGASGWGSTSNVVIPGSNDILPAP